MSPQDGAGIRDERALTLDYAATPLVRVVLPNVETGAGRDVPKTGGPLEIGFHRDLPHEYAGDLADRLYWFPGDGGTMVAALSVRSPGAVAVRLAIRLRNLGAGEIRFFGKESGSRFAPITTADIAGNGDAEGGALWSPVVDGDVVGIEVVLPSSASLRNFSLVVEKISHIHTSPRSSTDLFKEAGCANHIDVQCRDDIIHDGWEDAVAMIVFEEGSATNLCSGTLVNDTEDSSFIPYFLTAAHCVSSQHVAATVEASWFFQRATCGDGELDGRYIQTAGGAELLAISADHDAALMRLRGRLPGGLTFAGWSAERLDHPTDVYGIHHPGGGVKKYSAGATTGPLEEAPGLPTFNGISLDWHEGQTEGGSSGSGLFRSDDGSLVGTLSGGEPGCFAATDIYGSFAGFFPSVRRWLAPESGVADDYGDTPASAATVAIGVVRQGRLESGVDVDYFRIELATAGTIRVWTTGTTDTIGAIFREDRRVRIEDDNAGEDGNFLIAGNLPAGTYYLEVRGYAESTGTYAIESSFEAFIAEGDHADVRGAATVVAVGSTTEAELDWGHDLDYFRVDVDAPGTLRATTTGDTDTSGALLADDGSVLAEDDDGGTGTNFRIRHAVSAGTYFIEVRGFDADTTGAYALEISFEPSDEDHVDDHGDTREAATETSIPASVEGSLEQDGDTDYFRVELAEAATLWLETTGGIDTDGALMGEDGQTLREDDRKGVELLIADNIAAGIYYIEVRGAQDFTTGDYVLSIRVDPSGRSGTFRDAAAVDVPSSTAGELEADQRDYYRFELAESGVLRVETTGDTDTAGRLLGPHGDALAEDDDGGEGLNFRIESNLDPGTYYVEVRGASFWGIVARGSYTLEVSLEEFSPDAVDVEVPSSTEGELEADERDHYRFDLADPGLVRVETTGSTDTVGRLLAGHGGALAENDDGGEGLNFRIEKYVEPGTYYVEVRGASFLGTATGPYTLEVSLQEFVPDAVVVAVPSSTTGDFREDERDYFRVDLARSGILLAETTGDNDTVGRLLGEHGDVLAENDGSGQGFNFRIEEFLSPGRYYIEVRRGWLGDSGAYTLRTSLEAPLAVPSTTQGKLSDIGERDTFVIELAQPGTLVAATSGGIDTVGRILDENGAVVAENDDSGDGLNFGIRAALAAGTYFVEVRGFFGATGAYALHIGHSPLSRRLGDLDGDGRADVLLRHLDGRWSLRSMNGRRQVAVQEMDPTRNRHWRLSAVADLDGDDNDDLLLRHADGRWFFHGMDGSRSLADGRGGLLMPRGTDWMVAAVGDFLGPSDLKDVLLRHVDGRWRQYGIHGLDVHAHNWPGLPNGIEWQVVGVLNGGSLLLRHGSTLRWRLLDVGESKTTEWVGSEVALSGDPDIGPAGIGDLNGDGKDDLLLRDRDGRWKYRAMDRHRVIDAESGPADLPESLDWQLAGIGDLNGDGKEDVLLRHADGRWHYYAMDGRETIARDSGTAQLPADAAWSVAPLRAP